jgi:ribonuclease P protein component
MPQLLPPQRLPGRLKRRSDFLRLAAKGRKIARTGFVLQVLQGTAPALTIGFTATKKLGNAVIRNRTKRRLREAARLVLAERDAAGIELVLIGRRETATMDFAKLRANLAQAVDEVLA